MQDPLIPRQDAEAGGAATCAHPFVLGVVGDSGSGKSTVVEGVSRLLGPQRVTDLRLDDYHRFTREERAQRGVTALNPMVHNFPLMQDHLQLLRQGRHIRNRSYDHANGSFGPIRLIEPREVVVVRGLLGYPNDVLRSMYDLAVFLHPEPELLIRWKLRRDVLSRGYTEADVLKYIANHLLDSKQYVLPQAERADVVVRYELPDWEAPDTEVRTTLVLRRRAASFARDPQLLGELAEVGEVQHEGEEMRLLLPAQLAEESVEAWARRHFPDSYSSERIGSFVDEAGVSRHRPHMAVVEVLIARLTEVVKIARS